MRWIDAIAAAVTTHRKAVILIFLVATVGLGYGLTMVESQSSLDQFEADTVESDALDYVEANFDGDENETTVQVIVRDDDVLTREAYIELLEYERELRDNETVSDVLLEEDAVIGVPKVVATTAIQEDRAADLADRAGELNETAAALADGLDRLQTNPNATPEGVLDDVDANTTVDLTEDHYATFEEAADQLASAENRSQVEAAYAHGTRDVLEDEYDALSEDRDDLEDGIDPTLDEQIDQLESMNDSAVDDVTERVLAADTMRSDQVLRLLPIEYEPGTPDANATLLLVSLDGEEGSMAPGTAPEEIVDAELAMQELGDERGDDREYRVFGDGIVTNEIDGSMTESLMVVAPIAFLFVLLVLAVAYRDPLDILLGLFGIVLVLVWTIGFMGWMDVAFNQLFIAVPVLLIGLSIDYAIHVFMRHREERENGGDPLDPGRAMRLALGGVGIALVYVTATAMIGFLSNLASPLEPIGEFGVVSAVGIFAAFLVFGGFIPALKTEIDVWLESRRLDRKRTAFGTDGGSVGALLAVGGKLARTGPYVVIAIALVVSVGGAYGATQVDTSFETEDFLAEEPPDWTDDLPEELELTTYTAADSMSYLNDQFVREDSQAEILVEGEVTDDGTLEGLADGEKTAAEKNVTMAVGSGEAAITSPLSEMNRTAEGNETFNATLQAADTDGDGIPDQDLEALYDDFFAAAPDRADRVVYRTDDGEYEALRMVVSVDGGASGETVTDQMREVAAEIDSPDLAATATGQVILNSLTEDELFDTVVRSLLVSLLVVLLFLMATYRRTEGSATLGAVTMVPVGLTVTWILGTMYLLEVPFNIVTGMITSLTIGLGVAYSIHLTERYIQELDRQDSVWTAMDTSITGTGGALLGSAATTAGGFGVLVVAFLPFLQQFGLITALMIGYAFLASVVVLPSLLAVWTRLAGPEWTLEDFEEPDAVAAPSGPDPVGSGDGAGTGADGWGADDPFVPAAPGAVRTIDERVVAPGRTVPVEVSVPVVADRFVLRESVDSGSASVREISAPTVQTAETNGTIYAVVDASDADRVSVAYDVSVPDDLEDGTRVNVDGEIVTRSAEQVVDGDDAIVAIGDLYRRVLSRGGVTEGDLQAALDELEDGTLDEQEFQVLQRAWLRSTVDRSDIDHPSLPSE